MSTIILHRKLRERINYHPFGDNYWFNCEQENKKKTYQRKLNGWYLKLFNVSLVYIV